jgi:hypothetical protein
MRIWFLLAALILSGCSSHRAPPPNARLSDSITVIAGLNDQLRDWRGTPYRYGGMSRNGVDCSAFVMMTFRDKFNLSFPAIRVNRRKWERKSIRMNCCQAIWCSSKQAPVITVCMWASMTPIMPLSMHPPARSRAFFVKQCLLAEEFLAGASYLILPITSSE